MAIIGWIISICALLGGLALRQDMPIARADLIARGLFCVAFLACPAIWSAKPLGIGRVPRVMACLAMIFALPLLFMPLA